MSRLNAEFPSKDQFGPTIRMDGDLTAGDQKYEELISQSSVYGALHRQVYSIEFIKVFLELFRPSIQHAYKHGELLADPFALKIVSEPVEKRVSGRLFVGGAEPFIYPRIHIGYGGRVTACKWGQRHSHRQLASPHLNSGFPEHAAIHGRRQPSAVRAA